MKKTELEPITRIGAWGASTGRNIAVSPRVLAADVFGRNRIHTELEVTAGSASQTHALVHVR